MNKLNLHTFKKFGMTLALASIIVVLPVSASAASIPRGFSSRENCIGTLNNFKVSEIKSYGDRRIEIREARLKVIADLITPTEKNYGKYDERAPKVQKAIDAINGLKTKSLGTVQPGSQYDFTFASIPARKTDVNTLKASYDNAKNVISASKNELNKSGVSKTEAATAVCSVIYDAAIFSSVLPLAKKNYVQSRIDRLYLNNGLNQAMFNAARAVYDAKKSVDTKFDSNNELQQRLAAITDPASSTNNLLAAEAKLSDPSFDIKAVNAELTTISKVINQQKNDIKQLYKDIVKAPAKKSQSSNGTGGVSPQ